MSVERINSLIKTYFSDKLMRELERVFYAKSFIEYPKEVFEKFKGNFRSKDMGDKVRILILHNNDRINLYKALINLHWDRPVNFGTGTNRMAVIVDSYVFKIAMDHAGCVDNLHEFIMSSELQPYVTKCYETNELISVSEYVNVISDRAQFENRKDEIMDILRELEASTSLMLDVGFIPKNMTNWGVRPSDGKAVILDYGYLYTDLEGINLTCSDQTCIKKFGITRLIYTDDYSHMKCPNCGKEVSVLELQSLITSEARSRMYDSKIESAFKVTKPVTYFKVDEFGDYIEMEEADDSMLVTKKKRRENLEEVMERYREVCAEYDGQAITMGEPSDEIQQQRETLRRMILEIKYDMDYADMDLETQLEDPYQQEEVNINRMIELNDNPLDRFLYDVIDKDVDNDTRQRVKQEIEEEDGDEIESTFMTYRERDKILSRMLVDRGERPIVDDYDEEEEQDNYHPNYEDEEEFIPVFKKKEEPKNFNRNFGGMEITLGCKDEDEDILDETSKFIDSITSGTKSIDALDETSFEEAKIISDDIETVNDKKEVLNVELDKPGVKVEATVTNYINNLETVIKLEPEEVKGEDVGVTVEEIIMKLNGSTVELPDNDSEEIPNEDDEVNEDEFIMELNSYMVDLPGNDSEEVKGEEVEVDTDESIIELDDFMIDLLDSDSEEVISNGAEVSEEITNDANEVESEEVEDNTIVDVEEVEAEKDEPQEVVSEESVIDVESVNVPEEETEMAEKFKEAFACVQQTFEIPEHKDETESEISEERSNKTEEKQPTSIPKVMETQRYNPEEMTQVSFDDDDFDLDEIIQDVFSQDDEIETIDKNSFVQNVVRSEDEDLVDEEEVISTKHVEETVKKVDTNEDDFEFDDDDEFDEIYEQNYREKSMKSSRKNFK